MTRSGLEGQLLGATLQHERPELEQKKSALLAQEEQLKVQLADVERALLQELATSEGNILDNKALIESLNKTKEQSSTISSALANAKHIQQDLDKQRDSFRPIARTGSILFFLVAAVRALCYTPE